MQLSAARPAPREPCGAGGWRSRRLFYFGVLGAGHAPWSAHPLARAATVSETRAHFRLRCRLWRAARGNEDIRAFVSGDGVHDTPGLLAYARGKAISAEEEEARLISESRAQEEQQWQRVLIGDGQGPPLETPAASQAMCRIVLQRSRGSHL